MRKKKKFPVRIYEMQFKMRLLNVFRTFIFMLLMTTFFTACTKDDQKVNITDPLILAGIDEVSPADLEDSVVVNAIVSVTFKPGTDPLKVSASVLTLKKGNIVIPGTTTISGTTAIFTAKEDLTPDCEYTATIETRTGDIHNSLLNEYSWSFSTIAAKAGLSFALDVIPVLNLCNACHTHPWTTSSVASTFYTNLVNKGYVNPASPTSGKIYTKLSGGHPGSAISAANKTKVLTWITEGSKNN